MDNTKRSRFGQIGSSGSKRRKSCHSVYTTGAMAIGVPGWPELAFCTASMHNVRIVLTEMSSIEPVGAIKSSLSDLAEVTAAFVPPDRERRRCSRRSRP